MPDSFQQAVESRIANPKQESRYGYGIVKMQDEGLDKYFKENPHVAGMAIGNGLNGIDGERRIVFNEYARNSDGSKFSEAQKEALYKIEAMRHLGDEQKAAGHKIDFKITPEIDKWRKSKFKPNEPYYTDDQAFKETIISRVVAGDDAPSISPEIKSIVDKYEEILSQKNNYGKRPDGTNKGTGYLGELKLPDGSVATEYTTQSNAVTVNGERIDFPTLVPTLSKEEISLMQNDLIPNKKEIPESIMRKAIDHANMRLKKGLSVFK